jgi:hypothetical protein
MEAFHPQDEPIEIEALGALPPGVRRRVRRGIRLTLAEFERSIDRGRPLTWPNLRRLLLRRLHDAMRRRNGAEESSHLRIVRPVIESVRWYHGDRT